VEDILRHQRELEESFRVHLDDMGSNYGRRNKNTKGSLK
jgi:hypothetical protein